jgi:hypothetical protein
VFLQVTNTALATVILDEHVNGLVGNPDIRSFQAACDFCLRPKVPVGDDGFLLRHVAGYFHHFHTISERSRDGIEVVGGADEEDVREVDWNVHARKKVSPNIMEKDTRDVLMVEERSVLFGIEHLQKCTRRISMHPSSDFVNLIKHNKRVFGPYALEGLDDLARECTNVGSPVTLDLCHVGQTTNGEPEELPSECTSDGFTNTRLANTRRSDETEDLAFDGSAKLAYCDEL